MFIGQRRLNFVAFVQGGNKWPIEDRKIVDRVVERFFE